MVRHQTSFYLAILLTGLTLSFLSESLLAQPGEHNLEFDKLYEEVLDKYHREEYDEAIRLADMLCQKYPEEPAGVFGLMTSYQTIMRNYRVRSYEAKFDSLLNVAVKLSKKAVKKNKKIGRNYFYLACAYGARSVYSARRNKWFDAFRDGSQVLKNFKRTLAYDPQFYDAYYGLGLYNYWLGAKAKFLRSLPFVKDKRTEGLRQIKLAIAKGRFLKTDAMFGLSAAYYNEGEFEQALEVMKRLYQKFPKNPTLLYRRGRTFQQLQRWSEAKTTFAELYELLKSTLYQSMSYQVECLYQMAKCQYNLQELLDAQTLCQQAIDLERHCNFEKELDGPLDKFSEIKDQLHELKNEIESSLPADLSTARKE